jgi:hypothetical protein
MERQTECFTYPDCDGTGEDHDTVDTGTDQMPETD